MATAPGRIYPFSYVRFPIHFTDPNGVDIDPQSVLFRARDPGRGEYQWPYDGTNGPRTVVKTAAGHYQFDLFVNEPGGWFFRWEVTGGLGTSQTSAVGGKINVQHSRFSDPVPFQPILTRPTAPAKKSFSIYLPVLLHVI